LLYLEKQIKKIKRDIKSTNTDYLTGYTCALSMVEGLIVEARLEEETKEDDLK
jgi:hypothetical protein